MPELPEVETIKLFLEKNIIGLRVVSVEILNVKSFLGNTKLIEYKEITSVERRAKILRIGFDGLELLIHLKMSGQIILRKGAAAVGQEKFIGGHPTLDMFGELPNRSTRVIFNLSDGAILYFNDQRKFGWIKSVTTDQLAGEKFFSSLGPEPLEEDFSWEILKQNLSRRKKTAVKVALLDQEIVAGIGNIYACEACFLAKIDPRKRITELADEDYRKLHKAIKESLENGIKYGGSSKTHFANPEGKKGVFLDYAFVYGRDKLPCKKCGILISKIKLGGRGTFFCSQCQVD